ncbi:MAG: ribosome silencing factor [Methylacidiphilales bacterium]|nr:ribosome silencing factor [Candidatus Methylacidiphilales bacterium]
MPETSSASPTGLELARRCVQFAQDKKALEPVILDLRSISTICDYLVICSAQSEPQIKAIVNGIEKELKDVFGLKPLAVDGFPASQWVVIDYGEVMVHIFHEQRRGFYALEDLWSDAPQINVLQTT